jgi:hypothetical protein
MASPRSSPTPAGRNDAPAAPTVPDEDHGVDLPMSMTASIILTNLPKDASQALADVEALDDRKGTSTLSSSCLVPSLLINTLLLPITQRSFIAIELLPPCLMGYGDVLCGLTVLQYLFDSKRWAQPQFYDRRSLKSLLLRNSRPWSTFYVRGWNANQQIRYFYMSTVYLHPV